MRRRFVLVPAVLAALLAAGLCAAVLVEGMRLSAPAPALVGAPPAALAGAETVAIPSASGSTLRGWWLPGSGPGSVVLMHGVRGNRLQMAARAHVLHDAGFSMLLFDFEASGESPGRRITFGKLEALDAEAAVRFVRSRKPDDQVGAIGVSLGGAAALLGRGRLPVDALVLESVYPDIDAALSDRLRANLGGVAGPLFTPVLTPLFELLLPPVLGVTPRELRPIDHIAGTGAPVLVASGTADAYTPLAEAEALYSRAAEPKQFWAVPRAGHVDLEAYDPGAYWRVVLPFLDRTLRPGVARPAPR